MFVVNRGVEWSLIDRNQEIDKLIDVTEKTVKLLVNHRERIENIEKWIKTFENTMKELAKK